MEKKIENAVKTLVKVGMAGMIALVLANMAYAAIPVSDGFDYPVGIPDGTGYMHGQQPGGNDGWDFLENEGSVIHPGEDWNGNGGGDTDLGDPVYAISNGHIVAAGNYGSGWGNIILVEHQLRDGTIVWSNYAHLQDIIISNGYVRRGQKIGTIGKGYNNEYAAHLHFEIRRNYLAPNNWPSGQTAEQILANYYDPSDFIDSHRPQPSPLIGDWDGNNIDSTGTFNPRTSIFSLKNEAGQEVISHTMGDPGDLPIVGDWNGDKKATIGVYRPRTAEFFLDNNNDGIADQTIQFGSIGDYPIIGDWNKDGKDEIGVFRSLDPTTSKTTFYLRNPDGTVNSIEFATPTDMPIIGDWNNDGKDEVGVFRKSDPDHGNNAVFYLKNGDTTISIEYGSNDDIPIAGKPQSDGLTRIGTYTPSTGIFGFKPEPVTIPTSTSISLPKTGQTASYAAGDDGDKQAGIAWPSPRFDTSSNDGTVTDKLTGLMWLKDGNCTKDSGYDADGWITWDNAMGFAVSVNNGRDISACSYSGPAHNDWRVPNINELKSLVHSGFISETCGDVACSTDADWLNENGFSSMIADMYWSSTTSAYYTDAAWTVHFWDGQVGATYKTNDAFRVTLVRGTSDGPAKIAATGQQTSYVDKDDGYYKLGVTFPNPRFEDMGDGTVTDSLTGLTWLKDANCFGWISWSDSLNAISGFSTNPQNYACQGYTKTYPDWRMPNRNEMQSLADFSQATPVLTSEHPFINVQSWYAYWTSTAHPLSPSTGAIVMQTYDGGLAAWGTDGNTAYVWPVRGG